MTFDMALIVRGVKSSPCFLTHTRELITFSSPGPELAQATHGARLLYSSRVRLEWIRGTRGARAGSRWP